MKKRKREEERGERREEERGKERREHRKESKLEQRKRHVEDKEAERKDLGKGKRCSLN